MAKRTMQGGYIPPHRFQLEKLYALSGNDLALTHFGLVKTLL